MFEDLLERLSIVDEHVARRCAHEDLDAAGFSNLERLDLLDIGIGRAEIEAVVRGTAILCPTILCREFLARHRQRIDVRHIHEACDAAGNRGRRLGRQVSLMGKPWLAKVHLVIDHSRHQIPPRCVNNLGSVGSGNTGCDFFDAIALYKNIHLTNFAFINETRIGNQQIIHARDYERLVDGIHALRHNRSNDRQNGLRAANQGCVGL